MKQLFLVAAMAVAASGCADELRPIQIGNAQRLNESCEPEDGASIISGSLDVAPLSLGIPVGFPLVFTIASQLESTVTTVGEGQVSDGSRNRFIAEELEFGYTAQPAGSYVTETRPAYLVIEPGTQDNRLRVDLLTAKAMTTVFDQVEATGAPVTLTARMRLRGKLGTGQSAESNEVAFPITVYNSGFAGCADGSVLQLNGPCGGVGGYNGAPLTCGAP